MQWVGSEVGVCTRPPGLDDRVPGTDQLIPSLPSSVLTLGLRAGPATAVGRPIRIPIPIPIPGALTLSLFSSAWAIYWAEFLEGSVPRKSAGVVLLSAGQVPRAHLNI